MSSNIINNIPNEHKIDYSNSNIKKQSITNKIKHSSNLSNWKSNYSKNNKSSYSSYIGYDSYSNSDLSSKSNIFINKLANDITNTLKNKLSKAEFSYYKQYLIGKKVRDIIKSDGSFNLIDDKTDEVNEWIDSINNKISKLSKSPYKINYDRILLDSTFKEIVTNSSGYDAIVLENSDEYWIVSTCCDGESKEDVMAISYALLYQITGSDEMWYSLASLLINDNGKVGDFDIKELSNGYKYYEHQRDENIKLIEKYVNKGKKLSLGRYSLGGGIMLDSYARLYFKDQNKYADTTLTLFNPFMTYLEIDSKKYSNQKYSKEFTNLFDGGSLNSFNPLKISNKPNTLIDAIKNAGSNVLIYSSEGDIVSQFNSLTQIFDKQMVYIRGNSNISKDMTEITDIINLVMGENSRHNFKGIDLTTFDENGFLQEEGNQVTVNEVAGGDSSTNNLGKVIETIISNHIEKDIIVYIDLLPKEQEWMRSDLMNMYFDFRHYLVNNAGHYESKALIKSISPSLTQLLKKGAEKENSGAIIPNLFIDDAQIENALINYITTKEGKQNLQDILDYCILGDINNGLNKLQPFMTKLYYQTNIMQLLSDIQFNFKKGYDLGMQINNNSEIGIEKGKSL